MFRQCRLNTPLLVTRCNFTTYRITLITSWEAETTQFPATFPHPPNAPRSRLQAESVNTPKTAARKYQSTTVNVFHPRPESITQDTDQQTRNFIINTGVLTPETWVHWHALCCTKSAACFGAIRKHFSNKIEVYSEAYAMSVPGLCEENIIQKQRFQAWRLHLS
jgi:hypothetical protein